MKGYDDSFNNRSDKKDIVIYKISYFQEPYTRSKSKIEAELDLSIYATKPSIFC